LRFPHILYCFCALLLLLSSIQVVSAETNYVYSTEWGSYGTGNGQFKIPNGVAVDSEGYVYVTDFRNQRTQKFTSDGIFITQWGPSEESNTYPFNPVYQFVYPAGIAVDSADNVYVADQIGQILMFTSAGKFIKQYYYQYQNWPSSTYPVDVAVDSGGNIYAVYNNHVCVVKLTSENKYITSWVLGEGQSEAIATDSAGNVYVTAFDRVHKFDSTGTAITSWAAPGGAIEVDSADNVYVAAAGQINKFTSTGTPLARLDSYGTGIGQFLSVSGVAVDRIGNVYVADQDTNRILKFVPSNVQITPTATPVPINVQFAATPTSGTAPLPVQFTDTSTGSISAWQWDFNNDGIVDSTLQHPKYTYTKAGRYSVKLLVTSAGGTKSIVKPDYITVENVSVASISPDTAVSTVEDVGVSVRGTGFTSGTTFTLVNATLGTITCNTGTLTRVSDTELKGKISFTDAKVGLYDVVVTTPSGATASLDKGFSVLPVPVVLVHGWHGSGTNWASLENALDKEGVPHWNFDYRTWSDPTVSTVNELAAFIQTKRSTFYPDLYPNGYTGKTDIVCHSMGAIVTRWWMEATGHGNEVRQWIGIAPAHGGSAGADYISANHGPIAWLLLCALGSGSTQQLSTNSNSVRFLKTDALSSSTTYRVIAGWNPSRSLDFGPVPIPGLMYMTRAKAENGTAYWTINGDGIVATEQSYRDDMGFECFPVQGKTWGGNDEPASHFDHTSIYESPAVICRVVEYLKNPGLPKDAYKPVDPYAAEWLPISQLKSVMGTIKSNTHPVVWFILFGDPEGDAVPGARSVSFASRMRVNEMLIADLNWTEGSLSLELTDPNGKTYTSTANSSTSWSTKDANRLVLTVASPAAGNWSAKITPVSLPDHDVRYNLTMYRSGVDGTLAGETPTIGVVPGGISTPTSIGHNGKYDDINGNGAIDFNDVVLYFNQMDWIADNEPVSAFDFNKNGQIDFNDVVMLFNEM